MENYKEIYGICDEGDIVSDKDLLNDDSTVEDILNAENGGKQEKSFD